MNDKELHVRIEKLESDFEEYKYRIRSEIIEQDHRLWSSIYTLFESFRHQTERPYRWVALKAVLINIFLNRTTALVGGGVFVGVLTLMLMHQQNQELRYQNYLDYRAATENHSINVFEKLYEIRIEIDEGGNKSVVPIYSAKTRENALNSYLGTLALNVQKPSDLDLWEFIFGDKSEGYSTDLANVNLDGARLEDTSPDIDLIERFRISFKSANFSRSFLSDANLNSMDFSYANLEAAHFEHSSLEKANLNRANLKNADLERVSFLMADLTAANLEGARLAWANLEGAQITGANFNSVDFFNANLSGLEHIFQLSITEQTFPNFKAAKFEYANLEGVNFPWAIFVGAYFEGSNLKGANFSDADFTNAVLLGVDFTGANLSRANFTGASLEKTDLTSANLTKAIISCDQLKSASNWKKSTFDIHCN